MLFALLCILLNCREEEIYIQKNESVSASQTTDIHKRYRTSYESDKSVQKNLRKVHISSSLQKVSSVVHQDKSSKSKFAALQVY